jgi:hypothetical protein
MTMDVFWVALLSAGAGWGVPRLLTRVIGTRYRTERDCHACDTRRAVRDILKMVQELAIKAGVPVHEALKVGADLGSNDKR